MASSAIAAVRLAQSFVRRFYSCAGRDVHPDDIPQMGASLLEWSRSAASLMGQLSEQLARFKTQQDE